MKRFFMGLASILVVVVVVGALPSPAKADTSFSFSINEGHRHPPVRSRHYGHPHRAFHPAFREARYAPPSPWYAPPPPRRVVYQTTIVQPVRYVNEVSWMAEPVSPSFYNGQGQLCREYQTLTRIGVRNETAYGTACLQPDGAWRIVD